MPVFKRWDDLVKSFPVTVRLLIAAPECLIGLTLIVTAPISAFLGIKITAYADMKSVAGLLTILLVIAQVGGGLFLIHHGFSVIRGQRDESESETTTASPRD